MTKSNTDLNWEWHDVNEEVPTNAREVLVCYSEDNDADAVEVMIAYCDSGTWWACVFTDPELSEGSWLCEPLLYEVLKWAEIPKPV